MLQFFEAETGRIVLSIRGLDQAFREVKIAYENDDKMPDQALKECFALYFEAAEVVPDRWVPNADESTLRNFAGAGPSEKMRLAYYIVESDRLSRNPVLTRILLATADTLLEVLGENASSFIANPKSAALVEDLLYEFAVKRDFDDESAQEIYKGLLNALAVAVLGNPGVFPNKPLLRALFGALNDVKNDVGEDFLARLITEAGFQELVSAFLRQVGDDPSFITADQEIRDILSAMLRELSGKFPGFVEGDPKAVFSVFEAGLAVGASHVDTILNRHLGAHPLLSCVFSNLVVSVQKLSEENQFFATFAKGKILGDLYKTVLEAIAANPAALATEAKIKPFMAELLSGFAESLSGTDLKNVFSTETLIEMIHDSLTVLSRYPEMVARDNRFAMKVIQSVFEAATPLVKDGFQTGDVIALLDAALRTASENMSLLRMEHHLQAVLCAVSAELSREGVKRLLSVEGRKQAFFASLQAVAVNPKVWSKLAERDRVQPLVIGFLRGIEKDPSGLLSGPVLVDYTRRSLTAAALRGNQFISGQIKPDVIQTLIRLSLEAAKDEIGKSIDGENLPVFLERMILSYLKAPFHVTMTDDAEITVLAEAVVAAMEKER
jgi:hypothetical protein